MDNFSIIIPIYNEEENIILLFNDIIEKLSQFQNYEIIIIDDGSNDHTQQKLLAIKKNHKLRILENKKNFGQSYSIYKGVQNSKFGTIVTIDGDLQNNPIDIPRLLKYYFSNKDIKLVGGIRSKRADSFQKRIASIVANNFRMLILKDNCIDTGCSLKVFDKSIFINFPFFDGIHRFLPALFKGYGYNTKFVDVDHRQRKFGLSKYGNIKRLFIGIRDIYRVLKIIKKNKIKNG